MDAYLAEDQSDMTNRDRDASGTAAPPAEHRSVVTAARSSDAADAPREPTCTLSITSARPDAPFLKAIVTHLVRACRYPFVEKVLVMDTAPLAPRYLADPQLVSAETFYAIGQELIAEGVIDRVAHPDYSPAARRRVYSKHLGRDYWETHDFRGTQVLGTMQQIEDAQGDYFLHFDSDILLYQETGYNWIAEGIRLLSNVPEVMVALPLAGPPRKDRTLHQPFAQYMHDPRGFYGFKFITSRRFLINRAKFNALLPFEPLFRSRRRRWLSTFTRRSALLNWEQMATARMEKSPYLRADLDSGRAWTLHAPDHGSEFRRRLPAIIEDVERGHFPETQAGNYDLDLPAWIDSRHPAN